MNGIFSSNNRRKLHLDFMTSMGLVQTPGVNLMDPNLFHTSHPTITRDFFAFDHSITSMSWFSLRGYRKAVYPFISGYHCVCDFRNARRTYLLILNCIMNNLMSDTLSGMSFLSSRSFALFTPRRTPGACSGRIMLCWLCLLWELQTRLHQPAKHMHGIPMWNRSLTDQWTEQTTAASLVLARIRRCDLCHLQRLVKALIHARTPQSIWGRQLSLS